MPLNEPKRYVGIDPSALKAGDEVKIVESYESGLEVTFDGEIRDVHEETAEFATRKGDEPGVVAAWIKPREGCKVRAYIVPPQLPETPGAVIKFYDTSYLRNRVAVRGLDGEWYSAEIPGQPLDPIAPAEWTVLFDPRRDG